MRCEAEVRARLQACEAELRTLCEDMQRLTFEVQLGHDGWRDALEALATLQARRHALLEQRGSLEWVLSVGERRLAG